MMTEWISQENQLERFVYLRGMLEEIYEKEKKHKKKYLQMHNWSTCAFGRFAQTEFGQERGLYMRSRAGHVYGTIPALRNNSPTMPDPLSTNAAALFFGIPLHDAENLFLHTLGTSREVIGRVVKYIDVLTKEYAAPFLCDWSLHALSPYSAPELGSILHGEIFGDTRFPDGNPINTSAIKGGYTSTRGILYAQTQNTLYRLETPSHGFQQYLLAQGKNVKEYLSTLFPQREGILG